MSVKFDVEEISNDASLNMLNWEVIQARGIDAGDLMTLWQTAVDMGNSCAECYHHHLWWALPDEFGNEDPAAMHISQTFLMTAKFLAREAREIVKFLHSRRFIFPEGTTGKRPPDEPRLF